MNEALIRSIKETPVKYARALGFDLLTDVHNDWLRTMLLCPDDYTLLGHRGSYKTTCLSVALAFGAVLRPDKSTFFIRKTDDDVTEIVAQAQKILDSDLLRYIAYEIYGIDLELTTRSAYKIDTNLARSNRGQVQIQGMGLNGSITGKHADYIYTDDIVNVKDRISRAEREQTKRQYMELQNIRNRGGRIMNTGTPWHKDDCISTLMPNVHRFSVYDTGLISDDQQQQLRASMSPSLYAANYELRHIASDDALFGPPQFYAGKSADIYNGRAHIDAAYGGSDYTALTIIKRKPGGGYMSKTDKRDDVVLMARGSLQHITRKADIARWTGYGYHVVETANKGDDDADTDNAPEAAAEAATGANAEDPAPEATAEAAAEPHDEAPKRKTSRRKGGADA